MSCVALDLPSCCREACAGFHVKWLDNYNKILRVGVPNHLRGYYKSLIWTVEGVKTPHFAEQFVPTVPAMTYVMPPMTLFEADDIKELGLTLSELVHQPPERYMLVEGKLGTRIPTLPMDSDPAGGPISRRLRFKPRALHHANVQSNRGLFDLLEAHMAEEEPRRFRMLLLDVGIFDRTIKVPAMPNSGLNVAITHLPYR